MKKLLVLMMAFVLMGLEAVAKEQKNPNILLIIIDDLNDWIGVMNAHPNTKTPNMDRLANRGTLFTNAHAAAPVCSPTRATILSGLLPSTTGIYGSTRYDTLTGNPHVSQVDLLPAYFSKHGYKTLSTGKIFHEGSPKEAFDVVGVERHTFGPRPAERISYTPPEGYSTSTDWGAFPERDEQMPDYQYARWAEEQLQKEHAQPFFMSVGFVRPHVPWFVPQKWFDMHPLEEVMLPLHCESQFDDWPETALRFKELPQMPQMEWMREENRWRESVQAYLACVTFVDHCVGIVLDALEKSPHADNTIIMLVSDHGYHLGQKGLWSKHTVWEESTRIPFIISRPGDQKTNRTHVPANHLDMYPTLLELANLPANPANEGTSLVPLLDDPEAAGFENKASLTTHGFGNHGVRTKRWRYIRYADGAEELYDHWTDPNEWKNLAPLPNYAEVLEKLRTHLPEKDAYTDRGPQYNDYLRYWTRRTQKDHQE